MHAVRSLTLLLSSVILIVCTGTTRAADSPRLFDPEFSACHEPLPSDEIKRLQEDRRNYQKEIAAREGQLKGKEEDPVNRTPTDPKLHELQINLLKVSERLECARLRNLTDPTVRGPGAPKPNFVEVPVLYATDRVKDEKQREIPKKDPNTYFTGKLDPEFKDFSFGSVMVTIPTLRKPGELNLPSWWNFTSQPDPSRYFVLRDITELDRAALMKDLNDAGATANSSLLIFVHGFNVTFADAALRTAQLAHDLEFPGKVMLYSWPSGGRVIDYWQDEDSALISTPRFQHLLQDLLNSRIKRIYIVAHSMGTRIVIPAVPTLRAQGVDVSKVSELMLAAADFNEIQFRGLAAAFASLRGAGTHTTIYAASNDFALKASKIVHSYLRLGESEPKMGIYPSLDSVDASTAAPMRRAFGHSYVCDSRAVLGDMEDVVLKQLAPADRGLEPIAHTSGNGWRIPKLH